MISSNAPQPHRLPTDRPRLLAALTLRTAPPQQRAICCALCYAECIDPTRTRRYVSA